MEGAATEVASSLDLVVSPNARPVRSKPRVAKKKVSKPEKP